MGHTISKQNKRHNSVDLDTEDVCETIIIVICLINV